ncbi:MAG: tRNA (adenosine(37)-N6)-dimethylallyltransferase MiaA [Ferruginibacter sp.]
MKKTCLIICGPTAVGKTSLAIQFALHYNTQIISADSRQCFKELNIGVAKPSPAELNQVHHYFINSHSITEEVNAGTFETYALDSSATIFSANDIAVMVGGTGLYIKTFCEGMDEIPPVDPGIRQSIIDDYDKQGLQWLQDAVQQQDPVFFSKGEIQNPQRLMRALEVKLSTGNSIHSYQQEQKKERDFNIIKIGLELPREELYERINNRVDRMMRAGLAHEVQALSTYKKLNALQTVGYKELFDHFDGNISLDRAVELIKQNSRHYAKRQLTWFKKDKNIQWFNPDITVAKLEAVIFSDTKKR